uniref:SH3 domain-containing protein n=1 Tax=Macrostomum lignano TaxID=282301 RepID=A0A1I8IUT3_9PLAT
AAAATSDPFGDAPCLPAPPPVASAAPQDRLKKSSVHTAGAASVSASTPDLFASAGKKAATPTLSGSMSAQQQPTAALSMATSDDALSSSYNKAPSSSVERVVAKYRYQARNDDELTFEKGTIITVISKDEPDWHRGRTASLREGLFPVNYVEPLPQQEPNRQMVVNELTNSENTYYNDLLEVWNKFHEPMLESGLLTQDQLDAIFLNWTDLMNCSYSLLMAL